MTSTAIVEAKNAHFRSKLGFPLETVLAQEVLSMPDNVGGKLISEGTGTEVVPATEAGKVVKLSLERKRTFFSFSSFFKILDSSSYAYGGGLFIKEIANFLGRTRITMVDKNDQPVCLAVQEPLKLDRFYVIYARAPLFEKQEPDEIEQGVSFYRWYRVRDISNGMNDFRTVQVWNGNNFEPMWRVLAAKRVVPGQDGLTGMLPPNKVDNLVVDSKDESKVYALLSRQRTSDVAGWHLCIAPGTDVMLVLMIGAILDDMVGWFA